jgi:hypothetical protein
MHIRKATAEYEDRLRSQIPVIEEDLAVKHEKMAESPFAFLRATYYRWAQQFPELCPDEAGAPLVLAVGDLHVENFGTWRDAEGRLVWGVNDFDEAGELPYTSDLVRLVASARLAGEDHEAAEEILDGYKEGLRHGGRPFVLAERNESLRRMAEGSFKDPDKFWDKLESWPEVEGAPREVLDTVMPDPGLEYRVVHRVSGLGSLGRERFTAIAEWRGGKIAREAKALTAPRTYRSILAKAIRCPDPWVQVVGRWIVRRLGPDCVRIEGAAQKRVWRAMGFETANVHLGSAPPERLLEDLLGRGTDWLHRAAKRMTEAVERDWEDWRAVG